MLYQAEKYLGKTFLKTYLEHETKESFDETINIILSSKDMNHLKDIKSISLGDYSANCFFDKMIIHHENRHSDPLFFIKDKNNDPAIEINIYDLNAFNKADNKLIIHTTESKFEIEPKFIEQKQKINFKSNIIKENSDLILKIETPYQLEIIEQRLQWGIFNENRNVIQPGRHSIKLPKAFSDWYGIALSPTSIYDKIEHKHMIMGHLGKPSSRSIIDPVMNKTFHPEKPFFFYKSAIINATEIDYNIPFQIENDIFDEYEIIITQKLTKEQEKIFTKNIKKPYIITYLYKDNKNNTVIENKFIKSKTNLLFLDTSEKNLFDKNKKDFLTQLEKSWITSYFPTDNNAEYGISFSYPRKNENLKNINMRRFFDPNAACSNCPKNIIKKCKRLHPKGHINIIPKNNCQIKNILIET